MAAAAEARSRTVTIAVVVHQAYPVDIHQAMHSAPAAVRRAITAAPRRLAITAGPAHPARPARTR
jgi:hypothetical protein